MNHLWKMAAAPAATMFALAFFATTTPVSAADSVDYCRTDVSSGMRGCGYSSLEQCLSTSAGRGGSCFENPFPSGSATNASAYAYQPKHTRHAKRRIENQ